MADADVDALAREIVDWYLDPEPGFATHMGIHEYDHLMPDGRLKAKLDEIKAGKAFKKKADAISPKGLSIARTIDLAALRNTINLSLFEEEELRFWESMPGAPSTVGGALFSLFMRDFAPLPERLHSITERLERTTKYVDQTKERLPKPGEPGAGVAARAGRRLPLFLGGLR